MNYGMLGKNGINMDSGIKDQSDSDYMLGGLGGNAAKVAGTVARKNAKIVDDHVIKYVQLGSPKVKGMKVESLGSRKYKMRGNK